MKLNIKTAIQNLKNNGYTDGEIIHFKKVIEESNEEIKLNCILNAINYAIDAANSSGVTFQVKDSNKTRKEFYKPLNQLFGE